MTSNAITIAGLFASKIHTPLGVMASICDDEGLLTLQWQQEDFTIPAQDNHVSRETITELKAYLSGNLREFQSPISSQATSPALRKWLQHIASIPYGDTVSYQELARLWGNVKAARAAGSACQKNPLPLIVPCHRIIGTDGSYDKYSGGDPTSPTSKANVARKKALLHMEAGLSPIM